MNSTTWHRVNRFFSITATKDPFGDLSDRSIWNSVLTDLTLPALPPLFIIRDMVQVIQHLRDVDLIEIGAFRENLLHAYRNRFIFYLIHKDDSIAELFHILIAKTPGERRYFVPFMTRECARAIMDIHAFPFDPGFVDTTGEETLDMELTANLEKFLRAFTHRDRIFTPEQVHIFSYVRREEDIPIIREYGRAKKLLRPFSPSLAKRVRSTHSLQVEVDDARSPSMGGYSGITPGGEIEKITSILPSELAMMETGSDVDIFDVNLIENRLLSFLRDRHMDTRRYREFHLLFLSPESLDAKPEVIPFRWQYLFMAILFDIISFYRRYFNMRRFTFYFVFRDHVNQAIDVFQLLDMVRERDFPDIDIGAHSLSFNELSGYIARALGRDLKNRTLLSFGQKGFTTPLGSLPEIDHIITEYGQKEMTPKSYADRVIIQLTRIMTEKRFEFLIRDEEELAGVMGRIRDVLFF